MIWQILHLRARVATMLRRLEVLDHRVHELEQAVNVSTRNTTNVSTSVSGGYVTRPTESD